MQRHRPVVTSVLIAMSVSRRYIQQAEIRQLVPSIQEIRKLTLSERSTISNAAERDDENFPYRSRVQCEQLATATLFMEKREDIPTQNEYRDAACSLNWDASFRGGGILQVK